MSWLIDVYSTQVQSTGQSAGDRLQCAIAISALRVIAVNGAGKAIYADSSSPNPVIGLSISAGNPDEFIAFLPEGIWSDAGWNWNADQPLFLINDGLMSHTPPTSGYLQQVGYAKSSGAIVFSPDYESYLIQE